MSTNHYSYLDPKTGNITWEGPLTLQEGNHQNMPPRTEAYLPGEYETGGYDRGHVNASSLGGTNSKDNITPQHQDLNRAGGAYYNMERGERMALQNGATIDSSKTAIVNGNPGDKAQVFLVSDYVTYPDGHTESIHHSFTNAGYVEQQTWNDQTVALPGTFDAPNPEDGLRSSMSSSEYVELMENTDAGLIGISEYYTVADFSGVPSSCCTSADIGANDVGASDIGSADVGASSDSGSGADCGMDN